MRLRRRPGLRCRRRPGGRGRRDVGDGQFGKVEGGGLELRALGVCHAEDSEVQKEVEWKAD